MCEFIEKLIKVLSENSDAFLNGFFVIAGVILGWFLNLLTTEHQNKVRLAFVAEGTSNNELTDPELRTKTSLSELSIRIVNTGRTGYFLESFEIICKGHMLVDCYAVYDNHYVIMPNESIVYTLMQQDADALQHNYSKYYRKPSKAYFSFIHAMKRIPRLGNCIADPEFKQGKCKVIAYSLDGKRVRGQVDLAALYIRHTLKTSSIVIPEESNGNGF